MRIVDEARKKIEAILEGKEDERIFGKEVKEEAKRVSGEEKAEALPDRDENTKRKWYGIHVGNVVPNAKSIKYLGVVYAGKTIGADLFENDITGKVAEELLNLLKGEALKKGANAIVNLRFGSGSYEGFVKSWNRIYQYAYGEAVIVEEE